MTFKTIKAVADSSDKQWYLNQKETATLLGCSRQTAAAFLQDQAVPFYRIGREKSFFLPDVLEAVESTKWKT